MKLALGRADSVASGAFPDDYVALTERFGQLPSERVAYLLAQTCDCALVARTYRVLRLAGAPRRRYVDIIVATKSVGVRDLRNHAPKLIRRAARGERIVILRYGRPEAILGPFTGSATEPGWPEHMLEWRRQKVVFEQLSQKRLARYRGQYVAVYRGRVIAADQDHDRLFELVIDRHPAGTFFIGRVGAEPAIIDMPGFDIE